jgi:hypothetical protein
MIFNFFSRRVNTSKIPCCPKCKKTRLQRKMSIFATSHNLKEEEGADLPDIDESKIEKAMGALAREVENVDEERPEQAAKLIRKLTDMMGLKLSPGMEEAVRRMEKGEDPEKIEEELGDVLEEEDPFVLKEKITKVLKYKKPPAVDETLYEL